MPAFRTWPAIGAVAILCAGCASSVEGSGAAIGSGPTATKTTTPVPSSLPSGTPSSPALTFGPGPNPPTEVSSSPSPSATSSPRPSATDAKPTRSPVPTAHGPGASLAGAIRAMKKHGYDPADTSPPWYPQHKLNGIVGVVHESADGYNQLVFFFVGNHYIGNDTSEPSAVIHYVSGTDDTVTVKYAIYHSNDPNCCPSGGGKSVRYHWNGQLLVPLDPIPSTKGTGRR